MVIQSRAIHMEKCGEIALFFLGSEADVQQLIDKRHLASSSGKSPLVFATLCSALIFMETFMLKFPPQKIDDTTVTQNAVCAL